MKASTGLLTQFFSAAAVNAGTGGTARFRKAHCFRSISVYVPGGAIESDAKATEANAATNTRRWIIFPPDNGIPDCTLRVRKRSTWIDQPHKGGQYYMNAIFSLQFRPG